MSRAELHLWLGRLSEPASEREQVGVYQTRAQKERDAHTRHMTESKQPAGDLRRTLARNSRSQVVTIKWSCDGPWRRSDSCLLSEDPGGRSQREPQHQQTVARNGSGGRFCASSVGDLPLKLKVSLGANKSFTWCTLTRSDAASSLCYTFASRKRFQWLDSRDLSRF